MFKQLLSTSKRNAKWFRSPVNHYMHAAVQTAPPQETSLPHRSPVEHDNYASSIRSPVIEPQFWTGTNPLPDASYIIDCADMKLSKDNPSPEVANRMQEVFHRTGIVKLANTGFGDDLTAMKKYVSCVIDVPMDEYKAGANSRDSVDRQEVNVFDTGAPLSAFLHYHHEMAYVSKSVSKLGFCCKYSTRDPSKGATFFSDTVGTTDMILQTELGQKLKEKGISYIRCLTDREAGGVDNPENDESGVYNHWQTSFGVTDVDQAEAIARSRDLEFEWSHGRFLKTRYTTSAFEYFPQLDRNLLYSSPADDSVWFDTWPGVRKLPTMESFEAAQPNDRPLKIEYGDGTDFTREELELYIRLQDMNGLRLDWSQGDVVVFCNYRWAHGRPSVHLEPGEKRVLGVLLGDMIERVGHKEGKW